MVRVGVAIVLTTSVHRGLQQLELAGIRVEPGADAERQGPLVVDVADRKAVAHRDARAAGNTLPAPRRSPAHRRGIWRSSSVKRPTTMPASRSERADQPEVRQHPVHPIQRLADLLEEENRPVEVREDRACRSGTGAA